MKSFTVAIASVHICALILLAALLAPWPARAADAMQLPTLGDGSEMSSSVERRLGDRIAREIYRDPDYIDDPVLADYVQGIWQPLLAAARAWRPLH
jgi:predicted Zn-dependent protease